MRVLLKKFCYTCLLGLLFPAFLLAQKELKNTARARYADVVYKNMGFGEVNRQLLTEKHVRKINRRIQQIHADYGAVIIPVSLIAEEVADWESGVSSGLPVHFLGEDPRVARNHVTILFSEVEGKNWLLYGSDNAADFTTHTKK